MRWLVCAKMASCVRMTASLKQATAASSPVGAGMNSCIHAAECQAAELQHNSHQPTEVIADSQAKLLVEIRDLLRARLRSEAEVLDKTEEADEKKKEWKLASAVIDRILFITFSVVSVGGTAVFATVFALAFRQTA